MSKIIDLTGMTFGRLTVVRRSGSTSKGVAQWLCKCDCGRQSIVRGPHLRNGHTKSCGCLWTPYEDGSTPRALRRPRRTHGLTHSRSYAVWKGIIQRCTNPKNRGYARYGGRGITVCVRWLNFENFFSDMGERPVECSIDRIDNDGPYSPENCRWATSAEQVNNRSVSRKIEVGGETVSLRQASEITGIPYPTIMSRLNRGLSDAESLQAVGK